MWKKFGLTRKARSREARILVDRDGKAVGRIHPDTTFKILTMQFYFPVSNASFWDYGTCVHTKAQQAGEVARVHTSTPAHSRTRSLTHSLAVRLTSRCQGAVSHSYMNSVLVGSLLGGAAGRAERRGGRLLRKVHVRQPARPAIIHGRMFAHSVPV